MFSMNTGLSVVTLWALGPSLLSWCQCFANTLSTQCCVSQCFHFYRVKIMIAINVLFLISWTPLRHLCRIQLKPESSPLQGIAFSLALTQEESLGQRCPWLVYDEAPLIWTTPVLNFDSRSEFQIEHSPFRQNYWGKINLSSASFHPM